MFEEILLLIEEILQQLEEVLKEGVHLQLEEVVLLEVIIELLIDLHQEELVQEVILLQEGHLLLEQQVLEVLQVEAQAPEVLAEDQVEILVDLKEVIKKIQKK
jgi:hypothetical protein